MGFAWFRREKNFYLIFFGLLLFIVVLGTFDPSRVRLFGNIHVVLVLTYFYVCRDKKKSVVFENPLSRKSFFFFWLST